MTSHAILPAPLLVADIGGTNARFALVGADGVLAQAQALKCADHASPAAAARAYLTAVTPPRAPVRAAFAVASPVTGDEIAMTNHPWRFSIAATRRDLGLERLEVINDLSAIALSVPRLAPGDTVALCPGTAVSGAPIAVLAPGTGLGVAALMPDGERWIALASEGGHATLPAADDREAAVLAWVRTRDGHVSAERLLSGPGLVRLHQALAALAGRPVETLEPADISARAAAGETAARETLNVFFAMLGTVAGNLALILGARGGMMLSGGILPRLLPALRESSFLDRFRAKGRFCGYLSTIPVAVIVHPLPALVGLAGLREKQ